AVEAFAQRLALLLDREIDQRGGPAVRGRDRPRLEIIRRRGAAKRHVEVRVRVDAAREDIFSGRVDALVGLERNLRGDHADPSVLDQQIRFVGIAGGDDGAARNDGFHGSSLVMSAYESGRRSRKNCQVRRTSSIMSRFSSAVTSSSLSSLAHARIWPRGSQK